MASGLSSTISTRLQSVHSVLGQPCELPELQLPKNADVFKCYLWYRERENLVSLDGKASKRDIFKLVVGDVLKIWEKASMPVIAPSSVLNKLQKVVDKGQYLQKYPIKKRTSATFLTEKEAFEKVFDLCPCKCISKGLKDRNLCKCASKVPVLEWDFWLDQSSSRNMVIGSIDRRESEVLRKRADRKRRADYFREKHLENIGYCCTTNEPSQEITKDSESEMSPNEESNSEYSISDVSDSETKTKQNRHQYENLSQMMERTGISNRDACKIINACLRDMKLDQSENIIEATKLRRQRINWRRISTESHYLESKELLCIGFDGRIDETRIQKPDQRRRTEKEDHYVIVSYPNGKYIDHVAPQSGKSKDITCELLSVLRETNSIETLRAVTCDGTNVNTGEHNGVIRQLENYLQRPLQWLICMLHLNELPFRAVFQLIDGKTSGPRGFSGTIGKALKFENTNIPIVDFEAIPGSTYDLHDDIKKDLSTDQSYLLKACLTVQLGKQDANEDYLKFLGSALPGPLNHARWLTLANRILRLYMGTNKPSGDLIKIVKYIVQVYAPTWFQIKSHPDCTDGARNFHFLLQKCRAIEDTNIRKAVEHSLVINSYFAHYENVLLSALTDADVEIRKDSAKKIIASRIRTRSLAPIVRKFSKSEIILKMDGRTYYDMIEWNVSKITPPPVIDSISDDELIIQVEIGPLQISKFPCHTQAVERAIKEVTRASAKVFGHSARHGMIVQADESRRKIRNPVSKHSFLSN